MIISHKYKYIFIGLPFSGSSAISRELMSSYDGEPLFHKHANIPLLLKTNREFDIEKYFVFAVVRNPQDIMFTTYNKFLTNPYNTFTNPKYFIENGGFVRKQERELFAKFHSANWDFETFLKNKYKIFPYDNNLSLNRDYINGIIRFEKLSEDFKKILNKIEITSIRELPVYNKTKKISTENRLPENVVKEIFGPFLSYNKKFFPGVNVSDAPLLQKMKFKLLQRIRDRRILLYDLRQMNNKFSIEDLKNER